MKSIIEIKAEEFEPLILHNEGEPKITKDMYTGFIISITMRTSSFSNHISSTRLKCKKVITNANM